MLKYEKESIYVKGITNKVVLINKSVNITFSSLLNENKFNLQFLVIRKIAGNIPPVTININKSNILCKLADPNLNVAANIDILLGAEYFYNFIKDGYIQGSALLPAFQNSIFGWIATGPLPQIKPINSLKINMLCMHK